MGINISEVEKIYSKLPDKEFFAINKDELTIEAQLIYEREFENRQLLKQNSITEKIYHKIYSLQKRI